MSAELLQVQEQLQRARDNLRHVEEGIKRTSVSSNLRFGDGVSAGGGNRGLGRRIGGMAGVQRYRAEEATVEDEPPLKKSLSSVASRLGPILTGEKEEEPDPECPVEKSTVTSTLNQNRENASSVVSDSKTLDRSKRLFGSLLMGTLRQFKHDKESRKPAESKQAEVLSRIHKKEQETLARTQEDREKLVHAKDGVKDQIRLLEMQMNLAELKVRAVEERDMLSQFIRTKTAPPLYYLPAQHNTKTNKTLKDSNYRVTKLYNERIAALDRELRDIKRRLGEKEPVEEKLTELSTIKLESFTKTIVNEKGGGENPITGIKVEVKLRESEETVMKSDSEEERQPANGHHHDHDEEPERLKSKVDKPPTKSPASSPQRRSRSPKKASPRRRSSPKKRQCSRSPQRTRRSSTSPQRTRSSPSRSQPHRRRSSPRRSSASRTRSSPSRRHSGRRSPRPRSSGARPRSSSPKRKSTSRRKSNSPKTRKSRSPRREARSGSPIAKSNSGAGERAGPESKRQRAGRAPATSSSSGEEEGKKRSSSESSSASD